MQSPAVSGVPMTSAPAHADSFRLRVATAADVEAIRYVHLASLWGIGASTYGPAVTDSIVRHYPTVDSGLIASGTYYVIECGGEIAACAGWTRVGTQGKQPGAMRGSDGLARNPVLPSHAMLVRAMFEHPKWTRRGFGRHLLAHAEAQGQRAGCRVSALFATLTGVPLYEASGYRAVERWQVGIADGTFFTAVQMQKKLAVRAAA
jgi:GNAT superfamily N-acetyltransferase